MAPAREQHRGYFYYQQSFIRLNTLTDEEMTACYSLVVSIPPKLKRVLEAGSRQRVGLLIFFCRYYSVSALTFISCLSWRSSSSILMEKKLMGVRM